MFILTLVYQLYNYNIKEVHILHNEEFESVFLQCQMTSF